MRHDRPGRGPGRARLRPSARPPHCRAPGRARRAPASTSDRGARLGRMRRGGGARRDSRPLRLRRAGRAGVAVTALARFRPGIDALAALLAGEPVEWDAVGLTPAEVPAFCEKEDATSLLHLCLSLQDARGGWPPGLRDL